MSERINAKDLINIGIFTAIMFVVMFAVGCIGFIPVCMPLLPVLIPVISGIPFLLFMTKVHKFGMVSTMSFLLGLIMLATGHGWPAPVVATISGIIADLICKAGKYQSFKHLLFGYCVFSMWIIGNMLPMFIARDAYYAQISAGYGEEYARILFTVMPEWLLPVLAVTAMVFSALGALLGRAVLKKHFRKAGIA